MQQLHGALKRVQERGARYQVADESRPWAPSLGSLDCKTRSLDSRAPIHGNLSLGPDDSTVVAAGLALAVAAFDGC
jgi:hypothetical protein